jgi:NAD(P)-dependent dehydrogenase (short-subunit alcohol dehydrogenase family)
MGLQRPGDTPCVQTKCIVGTAATNNLHGQVALVTGGSRGIGKGIAQELARAGAIVYVTGRSTATDITDKLLSGSVDETAVMLNKLGGVGVALHADHSQMADNKIVCDIIEKNHGKLDCLINNAFFISKPDKIFFGSSIWKQPTRFLNEQIAVGSYNHGTMSLLLLGQLRHGKGLVVNISSWGSQCNIPVFPMSYLVNKAAFEGTQMALNRYLRTKYGICSICFWPGSIRSERSTVAAKRTGDKLNDLESVRFSGRAIASMMDMEPAEMVRYLKKGVVLAADFNVDKYGGHDIDGYAHEKQLLPYWNELPSNTPAANLMPLGLMPGGVEWGS